MSSQSDKSCILYINEKALDSCIDKVGDIEKLTFKCEKLIGKLTQAIIDELEYPASLKQNLKDGEIMVPVDLHPSHAAFANVEQMVQHLGVQVREPQRVRGWYR